MQRSMQRYLAAAALLAVIMRRAVGRREHLAFQRHRGAVVRWDHIPADGRGICRRPRGRSADNPVQRERGDVGRE